MLRNSLKIIGWAVFSPLIVLSLSGCFLDEDDIPPNQRHPCEVDSGIWIKEPTLDIAFSVSTESLSLYGLSGVDRHWYDCFPCEPDLDLVDVIITNETTGYDSEADDWLRKGILGYLHYWRGYVTVTPGLNNINVRLYYNNVEDGYDSLLLPMSLMLFLPLYPPISSLKPYLPVR